MNVNEKILKLEEITSIPVSPDKYNGKEDKYITFVYQDERPLAAADNKVIADKCDIYVFLVTPSDFNYMSLKRTIRDYLESEGFTVSISSHVETSINTISNLKEVRVVEFDCHYEDYR